MRLAETRKPNGQWALGIEDVQTGELCPVEGLGDSSTAVDAAIVVRGDMDNRPVLIVAGYETWGTLGAMQLLSKPGAILSRFNEVYRQSGYAEMVFQTKKGTTEPVLFQFPTAQNPRSR